MAPKPEADDPQAFREAVRDVRPLASAPRVVQRRKPRPQATFRRRDAVEVLEASLSLSAAELEVETADELSYRRPGVPEAVLRKLRRGQYRIEAELDLHGLTLPQARQSLREFLAEALAQQQRCLRIVHGKGLRSGPRGPVLKQAVNLRLRHTEAVLAFCSARQNDGGSGALYVLLTPPR